MLCVALNVVWALLFKAGDLIYCLWSAILLWVDISVMYRMPKGIDPFNDY